MSIRDLPSVRRFVPSEWPLYREIRLRALAESPDAFGSTHSREAQFTDSDWSDRVNNGCSSGIDLPLLAEISGKSAGLAWARFDDTAKEIATLYQMWVAPEYRRRGAGRALVGASVAWAKDMGAKSITLKVTCGDSPALRLYAAAGFMPLGDVEWLRPGASLMSQGMVLTL